MNGIFYRNSACFASLHEPPIKKGPECCPHSPDPPGTSPVGSPRPTSVGDADDFRAPLRLSEGVGGGKKYEQSLGHVAVIALIVLAFIRLGSPPPLRGLEDGIQCRSYIGTFFVAFGLAPLNWLRRLVPGKTANVFLSLWMNSALSPGSPGKHVRKRTGAVPKADKRNEGLDVYPGLGADGMFFAW